MAPRPGRLDQRSRRRVSPLQPSGKQRTGFSATMSSTVSSDTGSKNRPKASSARPSENRHLRPHWITGLRPVSSASSSPPNTWQTSDQKPKPQALISTKPGGAGTGSFFGNAASSDRLSRAAAKSPARPNQSAAAVRHPIRAAMMPSRLSAEARSGARARLRRQWASAAARWPW